MRPTRGDVVAGVTVAVVLVPQSLAYAELAGLPPVHGLYTAAAAPIAAALIGSSPYLQTGPVAVTSLLTLGALAPHAGADSGTLVAHAALLAILVGVIRVLLGVMRLGAISYLMSMPVIAGFTVAAAVLILLSQLPGIVGIRAEATNGVAVAAESVGRFPEWNLIAIAVGVTTCAVLVLGRRASTVFPWAFTVTAIALTASTVGVLSAPGLGPVPSGLPQLSLNLPGDAVPQLILAALIIAVIGLAEPASIARHYATADQVRWHPNREFIGQGLANLASGAAGGYPAGGSFSRSALGKLAGARTRWSGAFTGLIVLALLPVAGVLSALPRAVPAAIVIVAALSLVNHAAIREYWRHSRPQFLVLVTTFVVTLATAPRVELGLLIGVGLALAVHVWREMQIDMETWRDGVTLYVRPHGVLYFASAPILEAHTAALLAEHPTATRIVIDLRRLGRLDLTGLLTIRDFVAHAKDAGATVELDGIPPHAADRIRSVLGDGC